MPFQRRCRQCNKLFTTRRSRPRPYCSRECYYAAKRGEPPDLPADPSPLPIYVMPPGAPLPRAPSPKQIEKRAAECRRRWNEAERHERAGTEPWTPPAVSARDIDVSEL